MKTSHLVLMVGLIAPLPSYAANFCVKIGAGFGNGGSSFVGKGFALPAAGACNALAGYVKTATSVIANSSGVVLTLTIISTNPSFLGSGQISLDHIRLCPAGAAGCPIGAGQSIGGSFAGPAAKQNCSAALLRLPAVHD